ncbi:hypothetical protein HYS48_04465 [Candidatus Woesearchaeota archaeon]|nr:hypothetical protein [Candidatus Woesearchaeota archaeon]
MATEHALLQTIVEKLSQASFQKEEVLEQLLQRIRAFPFLLYDKHPDSYAWKIHLRSSLERICAELDGKVLFDPIPVGATTEHYSFFHRHGRLIVRDAEGPYSYIDEILFIEGQPVLFEAKSRKMASLRPRGKGKGEGHGKHVMSPTRVQHQLNPIQEYFKTMEVPYVLLLPEDQTVPSEKHQEIFERMKEHFATKGGILISVPMSSEAIRKEVAGFRKLYHMRRAFRHGRMVYWLEETGKIFPPVSIRYPLQRNDLLVHIVQRLSELRPDWDEIVRRFKNSQAYLEKKYNDQSLSGYLSEIHLRVSLEKICVGLEGRVTLDPIPNETFTDHYDFRHRGDRFIVFRRGRTHSEIDQVLAIDGFPILFELTLGKYDIRTAMRGKTLKRVLHPILEYYKTDKCGYAVIIAKDYVKPNAKLQVRFQERGGVIGTWYTAVATWHAEVARVKEQYNL